MRDFPKWQRALPLKMTQPQTEGIIIQPDAKSELVKIESVYPPLREIITQ